MSRVCWDDSQDYYHRDIDDGIPECGLALDISEDVIGIGDSNNYQSIPIGVPKCPECLWLPDNPNQADLFK